jgi:hypothetical protein
MDIEEDRSFFIGTFFDLEMEIGIGIGIEIQCNQPADQFIWSISVCPTWWLAVSTAYRCG